jgi:glyoxylate/hydroxypyruvate reductase
MSILINMPGRNIERLVDLLNKRLPEGEVEIYPNVKDPDDVEMALLWMHEAGSLTQYKNLKGLQCFGAGVDNILCDPELPNLPVARIVDPDLGKNMANFVFTMIQQHKLRLDMYRHQQDIALWKPRSPQKGNNVGILGLGDIGMDVAEFLAMAGFNVTGWSQSDKSHSSVQCLTGENGFDEIVKSSDYLICLLPLTRETSGILNQDVFESMKNSAILINVARGQHVVEEDLIAALYDKEIAGAYLDVFRIEPLPKAHPFWRTPNLHITPHVSAVTNVDTALEQILVNYEKVKNNQSMVNTIDRVKGY